MHQTADEYTPILRPYVKGWQWQRPIGVAGLLAHHPLLVICATSGLVAPCWAVITSLVTRLARLQNSVGWLIGGRAPGLPVAGWRMAPWMSTTSRTWSRSSQH
jgi:hypothetical protein